jgi:hypothetical protein
MKWWYKTKRCLDQKSRIGFVATTVIAALGLSLFFFSPKYWLMVHPVPESLEWNRAFSFLHQCADPFDQKVEPAMRWRLLPPLVAHAAGLTGMAALAIPYLGLLALLSYWTAAAERLFSDRLTAFLLTILLGSTSAVITVTGWLGLNDAWFLLGVVAVAAGTGWPSLIFSSLLAPWVDERFLLALPLALFCRWWLSGRPLGFHRKISCAALALLPYLGIRTVLSLRGHDHTSSQFLIGALRVVPIYLPFGRLGWWMGYRAAWIILLLAPMEWWSNASRLTFFAGLGCTLAGFGCITVLASDLSRSTNLLLPLLFCGARALQRRTAAPERTYIWLGATTAANLLIPYVAVTYTKMALVWGFPLELIRLYKNHL